MDKPVRTKLKTVKPGKVQRIIKPLHRNDVEKAEIAVEGADHLYKEIRIENILHDEKDNPAKLKQGAEVEVVVVAESEATVRNNSQSCSFDVPTLQASVDGTKSSTCRIALIEVLRRNRVRFQFAVGSST